MAQNQWHEIVSVVVDACERPEAAGTGPRAASDPGEWTGLRPGSVSLAGVLA